MKKLLLLIISILLASCASVKQIKSRVIQVTPEELGRDSAVLYILGKDYLAEPDIRAIENSYQVFSDAVAMTEDVGATKIKELILKELGDREKAKVIIESYWLKLAKYFNIDKLNGVDFVIVARKFRDGVEKALKVYEHKLR